MNIETKPDEYYADGSVSVWRCEITLDEFPLMHFVGEGQTETQAKGLALGAAASHVQGVALREIYGVWRQGKLQPFKPPAPAPAAPAAEGGDA